MTTETKALVLGGAECVWDDIDESERLLGPEWWDIVVAANDVGCHWPKQLDAWASLHPNKFRDWTKLRASLGHPNGYQTFTRRGSGQKHADVAVTHRFGGGASGLLAVTVALHLGATRVVLCGIPMEKVPHFAESEVHVRGRPWRPDAHRRKWKQHAAELSGTVRSMSRVYGPDGWRSSFTRNLLGAPSPEWLAGG